jgi:cytochrome c-type biogenesis protein CcmH/NrfF
MNSKSKDIAESAQKIIDDYVAKMKYEYPYQKETDYQTIILWVAAGIAVLLTVMMYFA